MDDVRPGSPGLPRRLDQALRLPSGILGILLLAGCRPSDPPAPKDLVSHVQAVERMAVSRSLPGWSVLDTASLDALARALERMPQPCSASALRAAMYPRFSPSDSVHSPGEALRTGRGSCIALTLLAVLLRERCHCGPTEIFVLPGHVAPGWNGLYFETLRQGTLRDSLFYRRFFSLDQRPWYRRPHPPADSALPGLLWHDAGVALADRGDCRPAVTATREALGLLPAYPNALIALSSCTDATEERLRLEAAGVSGDPRTPL